MSTVTLAAKAPSGTYHPEFLIKTAKTHPAATPEIALEGSSLNPDPEKAARVALKRDAFGLLARVNATPSLAGAGLRAHACTILRRKPDGSPSFVAAPAMQKVAFRKQKESSATSVDYTRDYAWLEKGKDEAPSISFPSKETLQRCLKKDPSLSRQYSDPEVLEDDVMRKGVLEAVARDLAENRLSHYDVYIRVANAFAEKVIISPGMTDPSITEVAIIAKQCAKDLSPSLLGRIGKTTDKAFGGAVAGAVAGALVAIPYPPALSLTVPAGASIGTSIVTQVGDQTHSDGTLTGRVVGALTVGSAAAIGGAIVGGALGTAASTLCPAAAPLIVPNAVLTGVALGAAVGASVGFEHGPKIGEKIAEGVEKAGEQAGLIA